MPVIGTHTTLSPTHPPEGRFDIINLFLRGNEVFKGFEPSSNFPQKTDLIKIADFLCGRTKSSGFVLCNLERDESRAKAKIINEILRVRAQRVSPSAQPRFEGKYCGVISLTSGRRYFIS